MLKKYKWLIALWKREWVHQKKRLIRQLLIEIGCIVLICLMYILFYKTFHRFTTYTLSLPEAVYAFWGIRDVESTSHIFFYIQWVLLPINIGVAWVQCKCAVDNIWMEEKNGSIFTICNQWYGRNQIIIAKYTWSVINFICNYTLLFVSIMVLAGSNSGEQRVQEWKHMLGIYGKSIIIMIMLISLSYCYAVFRERKLRTYMIDVLIFGTLILGNLYKVRDLIVLLVQRSNRNYAGILQTTGWLDALKWVSPLSWMNPFTSYQTMEVILQVIICITLSICAFWLSVLGYRIRRFK